MNTGSDNCTVDQMSSLCLNRYRYWLEKIPAGDPMHQELLDIKGNMPDIIDRFYQDIVFGTAGLRGICGAGTNRMNRYTVGRATQGIADYINHYRSCDMAAAAARTIAAAEPAAVTQTAAAAEPAAVTQTAAVAEPAAVTQTAAADRGVDEEFLADGVVIGYDCRYHSQEFSELAAEILAANGIKVYLFPSMRPTPELSFAIRQLHALSGINMTASHNPKEYNGYKVYWQDGAQISGNVSDGMQQAITRLDLFDNFPMMPLSQAIEKGLVVILHGYFDQFAESQKGDKDPSFEARPLQGNADTIPCTDSSGKANILQGVNVSNKSSILHNTTVTGKIRFSDNDNSTASLSVISDLDRAYLDYVATMRLRPDDVLDLSVPIVYTPLNGAGSIPMQCAAAERGFSSFRLVPEQKDPDPEFTTVGYPNPEDPKAFALAEKLARQTGAQLIIATDPDSDRMAIEIPENVDKPGSTSVARLHPDAAKSSADRNPVNLEELSGADKDIRSKDTVFVNSDIKTGNAAVIQNTSSAGRGLGSPIVPGNIHYRPLDGNQTGALIIAYRAQSMQEAGTLPSRACMIKSIVTGDMGRAICEHYGIKVFEALTGFKNICGRIPELQEQGYTYFFGYEESIGCAPGEAVRDKDGIAAGMILSEMAAWLAKRGQTIGGYLEDLYRQYGYYAQKQVSFVLKGQEGAARIGRIMKAFREEKPSVFHDRALTEPVIFKVTKVIDYLHGYQDIPASNVLKFIIDVSKEDSKLAESSLLNKASEANATAALDKASVPDGTGTSGKACESDENGASGKACESDENGVSGKAYGSDEKGALDGATWFAVRPSGTEPKIKFYYYTVSDNMATSQKRIEQLAAAVSAWAEGIQ